MYRIGEMRSLVIVAALLVMTLTACSSMLASTCKDTSDTAR